jgi:hypothetical protein
VTAYEIGKAVVLVAAGLAISFGLARQTYTALEKSSHSLAWWAGAGVFLVTIVACVAVAKAYLL